MTAKISIFFLLMLLAASAVYATGPYIDPMGCPDWQASTATDAAGSMIDPNSGGSTIDPNG